jgi:DNA-binding transcriptional MerR regulator
VKAPAVQHREYLTPGEVARLMRVDVRTVGRWDKLGKFARFGEGAVIRTPGGTRRYAADVISAIARGEGGH